jgi:hypothetical protein
MKILRKALLIIAFAALSGLSPLARAGTCGSGVVCFDAPLALTNANASTPTPIIAYTAPAAGSGSKITAIISDVVGVSNGAQSALQVYVVHGGTTYLIFTTSLSVQTNVNSSNILAYGNSGVSPVTDLNTDENGNSFIMVQPGDSLAIGLEYGIPASGSYSGTYYVHVIGQQY